MNSQIAITLLKDLEQSLDDYCELNDEGKTAFSMAITALELFGISEQLPSVQPELSNNSEELENKNGELISRQDAIDAVKFGITYAKAFNKSTGEVKELFKEGNKALNEAAERLKELPSVQPKERCIATITLNGEDIERIVKEQVEEIKDSLSRKGKWLRSGSDIFPYECDQCGDTNERRTTWCPYCGFRMEEGDSDDN